MNMESISALLKEGETETVEFKESLGKTQEIAKTIAGFANTHGGLLLIGVNSKGEIVGFKENSDRLQQTISAISQNVSPVPNLSIRVHSLKNRAVLAVKVSRATDHEYHTYDGAIYIRVGSTTRRLDGTSQLQYLRNRQILCFDESVSSASIKDLDKEKIQHYLEKRGQLSYLENHSTTDFLISKQLIDKNQKLKNAAVVLFAKNPVWFFPQLEVKLVRFSGTEPIEIIAHQLVQDNLPAQIEQALSFVKKHIEKKWVITETSQRQEHFEYPLTVMREAIVNAIAHRDYFGKDAVQVYIFDNRIEITSPGGLPNGLQESFLGSISVQRNPFIYRFLRDMGYVEGLGTGIPRMKNEMRKAKLKDPEFVTNALFFRVILSNKMGLKKPIESRDHLNMRQQDTLRFLKTHPSIKVKFHGQRHGISYPTALKDINEMVEYGYLKKVGISRNAYYVPA